MDPAGFILPRTGRVVSRLKRLIQEIHRRSLWQVMGIYLVGAWIAFEVTQTLTEGLGLPAWFPPLALVLLIVGLPIVLATALQAGRQGPLFLALGMSLSFVTLGLGVTALGHTVGLTPETVAEKSCIWLGVRVTSAGVTITSTVGPSVAV